MRQRQKKDVPIGRVDPDVLEVRRLALSLDGEVLTNELLVKATLLHPPAREMALKVVPYTADELPDVAEMMDDAGQADLDQPWPHDLEYDDCPSGLGDDDAPCERDDAVFTSLESFVGKLYSITPEQCWYRTSIANDFGQLRRRVVAAANECIRALPAHADAIRRFGRLLIDRASSSLDGAPEPVPQPIFVFSYRGHGVTTMLRTMARALGCRFVSIEDQITECSEFIRAVDDKPPAIVEAAGFMSCTPGNALQSILSFFSHGQAAREEYYSSALDQFDSTSDSGGLENVLKRCFTVFHIEPPAELADVSEFSAEELAVMLRNRQREEFERNPGIREVPDSHWNLIKNQNSIVFGPTSCRHMIHQLHKELRDTLAFTMKYGLGVSLSAHSKLKLCAVLLLEQGYPTPKDLSGAGRRLVYDAVDEVLVSDPAATGRYCLLVEQTNEDLPQLLCQKAMPTKHWFAALETQAKQQMYSGHRLHYEIKVDHDARTVTLRNLSMRAPKAVAGGAFLVARPKERFKDVIGWDDAKERLQTVVRYIRNPEPFHRLDTQPPKRILLAGPPGTGKTLLAKAFAGEVSLPFFSVSASEIMSQKWAGWGAARLRELFQAASVYRPSVIFLDELDAFGNRDGMGDGEAAMDQKSIMNTLLVLLDGVNTNEDIIVIGATNRPDDLDAALLRPKRFGACIECEPLKPLQRAELVRVNLREAVVDGSYTELVDYIAMRTAGPFSPAEIEEIVNEAKLAAEKTGRSKVDRATATEAIDTVVLGKKFREMSPACRSSTGYHEAGHAVVMKALLPHRKISRLTIGARSDSMGLLEWAEDESQERGFTFDELMFSIMQVLGGPVAESMHAPSRFRGTGGAFDLGLATRLCRWAVEDCGLGLGIRGAVLGYMPNKEDPWPPELLDEVSRVMEVCYTETARLLEALREPLDRLAARLVEREDMGEEDTASVLGALDVDRSAVLGALLRNVERETGSEE